MNYTIKKTTLLAQDCPISVLSYSVENPRAILLILHGMCEHKERYEYFMDKLAAAGYTTYIYDHRGHGESVASSNDYGYIGNDNTSILIEDAHQILGLVKAENPDKQVFMFAHSMGSLVARNFIKKYDDEIDALILSGHPFKRGGLGAGKLLVKTMKKMQGPRNHSVLLDKMALGDYNKAFEDEGLTAWISSDEGFVEKYDLDPLCSFRFTIEAYGHLLNLQQQAYTKRGWGMKNAKLPILLLAGEDDPCAGNLEHFRSSVMSLKQTGYDNVKWKRYKGCRHEVLNDTARDEFIKDVLRFISAL